MLSWNVFTMNQKTLPTSRRKVRWISTTSSGPGIVRRASALGMDETLPHFALGKSANLLRRIAAQGMTAYQPVTCIRDELPKLSVRLVRCSNPFDIP